MSLSTSAIAIGPQDELLRLTGVAGNPYQTVTATGAGAGAYYGAERTVRQRLAVSAVPSGSSPTLDVKFQDSADGVTYADMGYSFAQATADQVDATGAVTAAPVVTITTAPGRPWVREHHTIGGTATPTFTYAILHEMPRSF